MDNTTVDLAKDILDDIKSGKELPKQELVDMCSVLLFAFKEGIGWIAGKKRIPGFADSLEKSLKDVTDKADAVDIKRIKSLISKYEDGILDHHFWNDVDVEWAHGSKCVYGDSYGEDILIKLIALSEGKDGAGNLKF